MLACSEQKVRCIQAREGSPPWLVEELERTKQALMQLQHNVLLLRDVSNPDAFTPVSPPACEPPQSDGSVAVHEQGDRLWVICHAEGGFCAWFAWSLHRVKDTRHMCNPHEQVQSAGLLYGCIRASPEKDPQRQLTFCTGSHGDAQQPATCRPAHFVQPPAFLHELRSCWCRGSG